MTTKRWSQTSTGHKEEEEGGEREGDEAWRGRSLNRRLSYDSSKNLTMSLASIADLAFILHDTYHAGVMGRGTGGGGGELN